MLLYCVRHGESAFNAQGRIQGQTDVPLSDLGHRQAQCVAQRLSQYPIEAVYASPLSRALDTARHVAQRLSRPLIVEPLLQEINAGVFQGKLWAEIRAEFPREAERWAAHDPDFVIPQGESRRQLMARALTAFEAIRKAEHAQVAVVAHGGLLSAGFKALLQIPAQCNPFDLLNGSISALAWNEQVKLLWLNQVDHLAALSPGTVPAARGGDL